MVYFEEKRCFLFVSRVLNVIKIKNLFHSSLKRCTLNTINLLQRSERKMTSQQDPTYSIQQVADMTGLSKQLIRKWEDRYGIVSPERLQNGYRVYTDKEVAALSHVLQLTNEGYSVKQAAEIVKQRDEAPIFDHPTNDVHRLYIDETIQKLIDAGTIGDDTKMLHTLQQAHYTLGVKRTVDDVIVPFLYEVGELWCAGIWEEFQEALSSLVIRDYLAYLRRQLFLPSTATLILGSCLPNERHEIPMQLLLLQSMFLGYRTMMLGPSPAPAAIQSAIEQLKPKFVLLSALTEMPFQDQYRMIDELDAFAANYPHTTFYLGGPGAMQLKRQHPLHTIQIVSSIEDIFKTSSP